LLESTQLFHVFQKSPQLVCWQCFTPASRCNEFAKFSAFRSYGSVWIDGAGNAARTGALMRFASAAPPKAAPKLKMAATPVAGLATNSTRQAGFQPVFASDHMPTKSSIRQRIN